MDFRATKLTTWFLILGLGSAGGQENVTSRPLDVPDQGRPGFKRLEAADIGLVPTGTHNESDSDPVRQTHLCGLAAGDIDGDGRVDLFSCGMLTPHALFRNQGDWQFEDITATSGLKLGGWRLSGAVFADVDADRDLDLILTSVLDNRNFLYLNDGKGNFTESRKVEWVGNPRGGSISASLADVDGDGDLDLYTTGSVRQYIQYEMPKAASDKIAEAGREALRAGKRPSAEFFNYFRLIQNENVPMELAPTAVADRLYLNDGRGGFAPVADASRRFLNRRGQAVRAPRKPSHEAVFRDVDNDGDPDLYVTVDFEQRDDFWFNDGRGVFRESGPRALRRTSQFSMGIDFTDVNRDGHVDFLTADMLSRSHKRRKTQMGDMQVTDTVIGNVLNRPQIMQNTLQLNRGDGTWAEVAQLAGVKATEWSWGVRFTDVDLDGYEDLIVATGMTRDFMDSDTLTRVEEMKPNSTLEALAKTANWFPTLPTRNIAFRNRGDLTFADTGSEWGFDAENVSGGIVEADFDNDGDLDLIFNSHDAPLEIYRNETVAPRINVRLYGFGRNTQAIGAKVRLLGGPGGPAPMEHEIQCGGGYASGSDTLVVFGTGTVTNGLQIEVIWRNEGGHQRTLVKDVRPNHHYTLRQNESDEAYVYPKAFTAAELFRNVDMQLAHHATNNAPPQPVPHTEAAFDDFKYQSLLPNRLSQLGPGAAWTDLNGDQLDDLVISSGRSGELTVFQAKTNGGFRHLPGPVTDLDQTTVLGWHDATGKPALLVGRSNYEAPERKFESQTAATILDPANGFAATGGIPGTLSGTGPMAMADVDGDGDLDLFVGGRSKPARYPEPADSRLFLNQDGKFVADDANNPALQQLGLVSGAVFGDLDGDADPDLVLALEWGPITVFRNDKGKLTNITDELGLTKLSGWWNSVTLGDLDGDGRLDIVAGNWGRNSKYEKSYTATQPLRLAYADFDTNGVVDIVEYHFDKQTKKMVPERGRSCSTRAMPFLATRNVNYDVFGSRSLEEVYGQCLKNGKVLEASTLSHTLLLNRGGKFEARPLPLEAQLAPVFGINVADFNGDGNEDVFVAQNFFASQKETPRSDAGRGLVMLGDGQGGLKPLTGSESGIKVYGEQRSSAVSDFNRDGRPDLVVTQNGSYARLFENANGRPGLRVRLQGGSGNPSGFGTIIRLKFANGRLGPARNLSCGSGYWSQDSTVQVLAKPNEATHVVVHWPDGSKQEFGIPRGAKEITVKK